MTLPSPLRFELRCFTYMWNFRREYPGSLTATIFSYCLKRLFFQGLVWGGWCFTAFLLAMVSRPIWSPATAMSFHAFDAFTLFLMPMLIIGIGRFSLHKTQLKWRKTRRKAILYIRLKRRVQSSSGPHGGMVLSSGRIH